MSISQHNVKCVIATIKESVGRMMSESKKKYETRR